MIRRSIAVAGLLVLSMLGPASAQDAKRFPRGLPADDSYFPIAVWLQAPSNATRYKEIGINLYVGLWEGPTEKQLAELEKAGMRLICDQNAVGLKHLDSKTIVGWMHGDEPDNAQPRPKGKEGYDSPIKPAKIVADYEKLRKADPSRPVILNLGMGVAWDGWHGRKDRSGHPEDYPEYIKGCDIASFDIYPVVADAGEKYEPIRGKLELVPFGVERLVGWTKNEKPVWTCIETTHIGNPAIKPTPEQIRSEVWMAIIHGSRGLIYFAHEFKPKFVEAGLLADQTIADGVKAINAEVTSLAPVINSPAVKDGVAVESTDKDVPIAVMTRKYKGSTYVFAAAMRNQPTKAMFTLTDPTLTRGKADLIGENRVIQVTAGRWQDEFKGYEVHLYRISK